MIFLFGKYCTTNEMYQARRERHVR